MPNLEELLRLFPPNGDTRIFSEGGHYETSCSY